MTTSSVPCCPAPGACIVVSTLRMSNLDGGDDCPQTTATKHIGSPRITKVFRRNRMTFFTSRSRLQILARISLFASWTPWIIHPPASVEAVFDILPLPSDHKGAPSRTPINTASSAALLTNQAPQAWPKTHRARVPGRHSFPVTSLIG